LPYAPDSARALLATAGIIDRNGDGIVDLENAKPFRIELKLPANNRLNADIAEMIRADLADVGVRVSTRPTEYGTMVADVVAPERKFDAVLMGWESDFKLVLRDQFHSDAINNQLQFAHYRNPEIDRLLDQLDTTMSPEAAAPLWRRLQTIMRDEEPWTFLFYYGTEYGARERLQGVEMDIRGWLVSAPEWWLRQ
jgi:peptide/nickel transport system substrate-binding protein